jgi:hypothetical protein
MITTPLKGQLIKYLLHLHEFGIDGYQSTRFRQFLVPKAFMFDEVLVAIPSFPEGSVKFGRDNHYERTLILKSHDSILKGQSHQVID